MCVCVCVCVGFFVQSAEKPTQMTSYLDGTKCQTQTKEGKNSSGSSVRVAYVYMACVCVWMRVCDLTKAREDTLRQKEGWRDGG